MRWDLLPLCRPLRGARRSRQDTAPALGIGALALALAVSWTSGCETPPHDVSASVAERAALDAALDAHPAAPADAALVVRLAFGADADLDLYLTDLGRRGNETVYFARHTSRTGGRMLADARCGDPAPRVDAAMFEAPLPEGVRIGVDYHASCSGSAQPAPFVVEISRGAERQRRYGVATPGHFDDQFWRVTTSGKTLEDQYIPKVK